MRVHARADLESVGSQVGGGNFVAEHFQQRPKSRRGSAVVVGNEQLGARVGVHNTHWLGLSRMSFLKIIEEPRRSDTIVQEMREKWVFIAAAAGITCLMPAPGRPRAGRRC